MIFLSWSGTSSIIVNNKKKGQISIDYISGYILFLFVVLYITFSVIHTVPTYLQKSTENSLNEEVWILTEKILDNLSSEVSITDSELQAMSQCDFTNTLYSDIKTHFNVDNRSDFHIFIVQYPVAITDMQNGMNFTGNLTIDGILMNFETYNSSDHFDKVKIDNGTGSFLVSENDVVTINSSNYDVEKIDPFGNFVILSREWVDCGRYPGWHVNSVAKRYVSYKEFITQIKILYW